MANISFNIACKELKIAQIAQLNQIFQLLHLVHIYGLGFYELSHMLIRKNVNNVPFPRSEFRKRRFSYDEAVLWNSLQQSYGKLAVNVTLNSAYYFQCTALLKGKLFSHFILISYKNVCFTCVNIIVTLFTACLWILTMQGCH